MMRKNAPLEHSNVAVLLEHIPIGQTRSIHSLRVTRVEADHYSIGGGRIVDLAAAIEQIGSYSGHGAVKSHGAVKPSASRPVAKRNNPQKAERGYFYEVLDKRGDVVVLTTTKGEAEDVANNPVSYKLKKGAYTVRHVGAQSALEGPPIRKL